MLHRTLGHGGNRSGRNGRGSQSETGLELADEWVGRNAMRVVALGEMGIGNTTTAATLVAALLAADPGAKVLAGGQSLMPVLAFRLAAPSLLVDLHHCATTGCRMLLDLRAAFETEAQLFASDPNLGPTSWSPAV